MTKPTTDTDQPHARLALIESALHAFAHHGINGVSLRTIVADAGQHNQSAIHYHFKNKQGLVVAVLAYVSELLAPEMQRSLADFAQQPSVNWRPLDLTELICRPFIKIDTDGGVGRTAIKFMSRLTWQEGGQGQLLLVQAVQPYFSQFSPALIALNPGKPIDMLTFQLYLAVNTLIHGLADSGLLTRSPAMGVEQIRRDKPKQMLNYFMGYIAGGLFTPVDTEAPTALD
ncbi:MAG: TetR/AcrR family transcriptional regulator [Paraperlucidibaca sp.]